MKKIISLLLSTTVIFAGCSGEKTEQEVQNETAPLKVVTTIAPLYSLTSYLIEGTNVELGNLLPPGSSEHLQNLTPEAAKALNEADLMIINGLQLEAFLNSSLQDAKAIVVDTSIGVDAIQFTEAEEIEEHGQFDPHIWLSPKNAKIQSKNIYEALVVQDPLNIDLYGKNLQNLSAKLDALYTTGKSRLVALDVKPYIVFHDAYQYFEKDFDVHSTAFLEEFAGQEPSAQYLAEVIDIIKANNVKVAFSEPQFSPKLLQTLSQDYGLTLGELDPVGQQASHDAYFTLINDNIAEFEKLFAKKS